MNENRPGVTSKVLTPEEALYRLKRAIKDMPYISTVGIAGPGDSLANPERTFRTIELIKRVFPSMLICLSTNGLMLPDYWKPLILSGVTHLTVTVNAVREEIAEKIYNSVRLKGKSCTGREGARILIERQMEGLERLMGTGILVKVNTIYIEGINSSHIMEVVRTLRDYDIHTFNIIPLIPVKGTPFEGIACVDKGKFLKIKDELRSAVALMDHCRQCRSDACGLIHEEKTIWLEKKRACL